MRLVIVSGALAAMLAFAVPAPARGASEVQAQIGTVQITMRPRLLYRGPVTGIADERTSSAVMTLQRRLGVTADGIFGPQTRGRLFPYGTPVLGKRLLRAVPGTRPARTYLEVRVRGAYVDPLTALP